MAAGADDGGGAAGVVRGNGVSRGRAGRPLRDDDGDIRALAGGAAAKPGRAAASPLGERTELLTLPAKVSPAELAETLRAGGAGSGIEWIQPDYVLRPASEEEEPSFIVIEEGEDEEDAAPLMSWGDDGVMIGLIDSFVETDHPALR